MLLVFQSHRMLWWGQANQTHRSQRWLVYSVSFRIHQNQWRREWIQNHLLFQLLPLVFQNLQRMEQLLLLHQIRQKMGLLLTRSLPRVYQNLQIQMVSQVKQHQIRQIR